MNKKIREKEREHKEKKFSSQSATMNAVKTHLASKFLTQLAIAKTTRGNVAKDREEDVRDLMHNWKSN